jgi:hypothetical protein
MSLSYKDFFPVVIKERFFSDDYEELLATVARASEWVEESGVRVLNVETVVLPNIKGIKGASKFLMINSSNEWYQVIRVWYEHPNQLVNPLV